MILILDFGSQFTQLIAKKIRKLEVYTEIYHYDANFKEIASKKKIEGIILSDGFDNLVDKKTQQTIQQQIEELQVPVLGIGYGMHLLSSFMLDKKAHYNPLGQFHEELAKLDSSSLLFKDLTVSEKVWVGQHNPHFILPSGFASIAQNQQGHVLAVHCLEKKYYGVQFHPEVAHTHSGNIILKNFVFEICHAPAQWKTQSFIQDAITKTQELVKDKKVVLGLSGGVDSSVLAVLLNKAIKKQLVCVFVDNGLMRKDEGAKIKEIFTQNFDLNFQYVDASQKFLKALKGVKDPEKKRKIIGKVFLKVFDKAVKNFDFLAQGTLYPDVIESVTINGKLGVKTHHNRVKGVLDLIKQGKILEPFKELFKDEVREIGKELNLPAEIINRHPFPGPSLAIRVLGEVTLEKLSLLREADAIIVEEIKKAGIYENLWQAFGIFLPVKSVGVKGDKRTYENVIALRIVESTDGMTAHWANIDYQILNTISARIINEIKGINRVVYDISSKPPATIEWE